MLLFKIWSGRRGSNSRPQPWQGCALPTELLPHLLLYFYYAKNMWSGRRGSNSRPQPWQGCALPTELLPHLLLYFYYTKNMWSGRRGSNSRPQPWQGCALPTELLPHQQQAHIIYQPAFVSRGFVSRTFFPYQNLPLTLRKMTCIFLNEWPCFA